MDKITPEELAPKQEIIDQVQQEKQMRRIMQAKRQPGHTLYEYNKESNVLSKAEVIKQPVDYVAASMGVQYAPNLVNVKPNCAYVTALNVKNAVKHIRKLLNDNTISPVFA